MACLLLRDMAARLLALSLGCKFQSQGWFRGLPEGGVLQAVVQQHFICMLGSPALSESTASFASCSQTFTPHIACECDLITEHSGAY